MCLSRGQRADRKRGDARIGELVALKGGNTNYETFQELLSTWQTPTAHYAKWLAMCRLNGCGSWRMYQQAWITVGALPVTPAELFFNCIRRDFESLQKVPSTLTGYNMINADSSSMSPGFAGLTPRLPAETLDPYLPTKMGPITRLVRTACRGFFILPTFN